jgi:hypothetical protein
LRMRCSPGDIGPNSHSQRPREIRTRPLRMCRAKSIPLSLRYRFDVKRQHALPVSVVRSAFYFYLINSVQRVFRISEFSALGMVFASGPQNLAGCRRECGWNLFSGISGAMKLSDQAATSTS